jgi:hypothetical protein
LYFFNFKFQKKYVKLFTLFFKDFLGLFNTVVEFISTTYLIEKLDLFVRRFDIIKLYVDFSYEVACIVLFLFKNTSLTRFLFFITFSSLFNIFYFHTFSHNVYTTSLKTQLGLWFTKKLKSSYFMGFYRVLYSYLYKFIFHRKWWYTLQSAVFSYHRTFLRWDNPMPFRFKQKFKIKIIRRPNYHRLKYNLMYVIKKDCHLWHGDEMKRRKRQHCYHYSKYFRSNSNLSFLNHRGKMARYSSVSSNLRQMQNAHYFGKFLSYRRCVLYMYVRHLYWGLDNASFHTLMVNKYYNIVIPKTQSTRSLQWFWRYADTYVWNTPYAANGLPSYSSVFWRVHFKIERYHPEIFVKRVYLPRRFRPLVLNYEDMAHHAFQKWTKIRFIRRLHRKGYRRIWKKQLPRIRDHYDISGFDITNFNLPDFTDFSFLFNFFKNFF